MSLSLLRSSSRHTLEANVITYSSALQATWLQNLHLLGQLACLGLVFTSKLCWPRFLRHCCVEATLVTYTSLFSQAGLWQQCLQSILADRCL